MISQSFKKKYETCEPQASVKSINIVCSKTLL